MIQYLHDTILYASQNLHEVLLGLAVVIFGNGILLFGWGALMDGRDSWTLSRTFKEFKGMWVATIMIGLLDIYYVTILLFAIALRNYK